MLLFYVLLTLSIDWVKLFVYSVAYFCIYLNTVVSLVHSLSLIVLTLVLDLPLQINFCPRCLLWWCRITFPLFCSCESLGSLF